MSTLTFRRISCAFATRGADPVIGWIAVAGPERGRDVNGEPITNYDIEQRIKLTQLSTQKASSRQEVIDELINEKVKIKEGQEVQRRSGASRSMVPSRT